MLKCLLDLNKERMHLQMDVMTCSIFEEHCPQIRLTTNLRVHQKKGLITDSRRCPQEAHAQLYLLPVSKGRNFFYFNLNSNRKVKSIRFSVLEVCSEQVWAKGKKNTVTISTSQPGVIQNRKETEKN